MGCLLRERTGDPSDRTNKRTILNQVQSENQDVHCKSDGRQKNNNEEDQLRQRNEQY